MFAALSFSCALLLLLLASTNCRCSAFHILSRLQSQGQLDRQVTRPQLSSRIQFHRSASTPAALVPMSAAAAASGETDARTKNDARPFRIRTITAFVALHPADFDGVGAVGLVAKMDACADILRTLEKSLSDVGYEVQTVRIATNPFGEWLTTNAGIDDHGDNGPKNDATSPQKEATTNRDDGSGVEDKLGKLNALLNDRKIDFCSLGPSTNPEHTAETCPLIVSMRPGRFSCSANVEAGDVDAARAAARCMRRISALGEEDVPNPLLGDGDGGGASHIEGGLGNFRFCAASRVGTVPFFPGARAPSDLKRERFAFAIGLENGGFARGLLEEATNIGKIKDVFDTKMREGLMPIQDICSKFASATDHPVEYLGIDTSLNPSLDDGGSVADAIERLEEVRGGFGGTGSLAAAAAITTSLQSIPDILTTGYSGLMLPVLEDRRLAELGASSSRSRDRLTIQKLLCISSVCGVGIDTVPIPGNASEDELSSLLLDVAALACRWNKPLSCRVFPVPGGSAGEKTTFDSPYMCNSCIFEL